MKIVSLNMEGKKHFSLVESFVKNEKPDCVCLQEAPELFSLWLHRAGYQTAFAPTSIRVDDTGQFKEGVMFASQIPFTSQTEYYHKSAEEIVLYSPEDNINTAGAAVILATIQHPETGEYAVATTHVMVTKGGLPDAHQRMGIQKLLSTLATKPPHILCGDFNIPRGFNDLYEEITKTYTDTIPPHYQSSLDRSLHRLGTKTDLDSPMFESYMVDYLFTLPPYTAHNVRLQFGVSDHAGIVAEISNNKSQD
jgi:endonuclease/exonuclease/phosphatase family metal-dependent hydrolase